MVTVLRSCVEDPAGNLFAVVLWQIATQPTHVGLHLLLIHGLDIAMAVSMRNGFMILSISKGLFSFLNVQR